MGSQGPNTRGTEISAPFWRSVDAEALELPWCATCETWFFYPRRFCPACRSAAVAWRPVSGRGTVWSATVVHVPFFRGEWAQRLPYVVAIVELEEGVRLLTNIVACPVEEVRAGLAVGIAYRRIGDDLLPQFEPVP